MLIRYSINQNTTHIHWNIINNYECKIDMKAQFLFPWNPIFREVFLKIMFAFSLEMKMKCRKIIHCSNVRRYLKNFSLGQNYLRRGCTLIFNKTFRSQNHNLIPKSHDQKYKKLNHMNFQCNKNVCFKLDKIIVYFIKFEIS